MISRRHIRLKVMQSLYAFFIGKQNDIEDCQKNMIRQIQDIAQLQLILLSFLFEITNYANSFFNQQKDKHFPKKDDLNPNNKRFTNNIILKNLASNKRLIKRLEVISDIWESDDYNIVRTIFINLYHSETYKTYINSDDFSIDSEQSFLVSILDKYILNDKLFQHMLEKQSIYWLDDLPFISLSLVIQIRAFSNEKTIRSIDDVFKNKEDMKFAINLFKKTIIHDSAFESIIIDRAQNWDLDRIATMDKILIKMALCEILYMEDLPVKVSMNEYLEISKYYSTRKSKKFINGILDTTVKEFNREGKIKKTGRGLM